MQMPDQARSERSDALAASDLPMTAFVRETLPNAEVIRIRGEVDLSTADEFRKIVDDVIALRKMVVVDLQKCTYIDSTGLQVIARAYKHCADLRVVVPEGSIHRIFDITGLTDQLKVRTTLAEALA